MKIFFPFLQRLIAILQLCIAFSLILWYVTQPFMGEYFNLRSHMLLYEFVMGTSHRLKEEGQAERQIDRFKKLPELEQKTLEKDYQKLFSYANRSPFRKIQEGLSMLIQDVPLFEQAWIFFSITIAILALLRIEGSKQAALLLPLIAFAYLIDNQANGQVLSPPPDRLLFPTEEKIVQNYLNEPLASSPLQQKEQLEKGWKLYLIDQWSKNHPKDLEEAEFQFTLARLRLLKKVDLQFLSSFHVKLELFSLLSYFIWNVLFAWVISYDSNNLKTPIPAKYPTKAANPTRRIYQKN